MELLRQLAGATASDPVGASAVILGLLLAAGILVSAIGVFALTWTVGTFLVPPRRSLRRRWPD